MDKFGLKLKPTGICNRNITNVLVETIVVDNNNVEIIFRQSWDEYLSEMHVK